MTFGSWRGMGWGGAAVVLASAGLAGCPGGSGGGGCPEISGSWSVQGSCVSEATSCEFDQSGCSIALTCSDGRTLNGTVSKSSVRFSDDEVSCSGSLDNLEDDDGDGVIHPQIEASCTPKGGEACEIEVGCLSGDCTMPEDEDDGSDEGDSGEGSSGQGGSSGFLGGGNGGNGGAGQGGVGGEWPAGEGGVSGAGQGGVSGVPAGQGGASGSVGTDCESCVNTACGSEASACAAASGCLAAADCLFNSGCYFDDGVCLDSACSTVPEPSSAGLDALTNLFTCTASSCANSCPVYSGDPIGGAGGASGASGAGGVGGVPPGPGGCDDSCDLVDGECDDGGPGSITAICDYGTDCTDCGPREAGSAGF